MKKESLKRNNNHLAIERLTEYYNTMNTIKRLNKEIAWAVKQGGPKNKLTACYDENKGGYVSPAHDSAIRVFAGIQGKKATIMASLVMLEEVMDALSNLSRDERLALVMRYVDDHPIKTICTELNYSSRQSVYTLLSSAAEKFSRNLGFDA